MFQRNVVALQREGTSIIEMQTVLHTVNTSVADRLASKFVTQRTKHLVTQMLEGDYEEESKEFFHHVGWLYFSFLRVFECVDEAV
jgi:hypothetical protein